jgi:hypothetical protein
MGYIGQAPANKVVTSADIEDGVISAADLGANSVDSSELVDGSIDTSHLADNQVTLAKMAGLARGKLIYGDASGDPAALAVGSANEVLTHDGTDFDWAAAGGGITVADQWRVTSGFTGDADPISSNWEQVDTSGQGTLGSAMTESSGVFTFPSTGIYYVEFNFGISASANSRFQYCNIHVTVDNSTYASISEGLTFMNSPSSNSFASAAQNSLVDVTDTANVKIRFAAVNNDDSNTFRGSSTYNSMWATFIRLGDT